MKLGGLIYKPRDGRVKMGGWSPVDPPMAEKNLPIAALSTKVSCPA